MKEHQIDKEDEEWMNAPLGKLKAQEPPAGEFTKRYRELIKLSEEHLSKSKIGRLRKYGREACNIIDHQAEEKKRLIGHLKVALFYADPPHQAAKDRIKEAQEYLDSIK
jgi:hypothetical protein